jgi:hypothetical protein
MAAVALNGGLTWMPNYTLSNYQTMPTYAIVCTNAPVVVATQAVFSDGVESNEATGEPPSTGYKSRFIMIQHLRSANVFPHANVRSSSV